MTPNRVIRRVHPGDQETCHNCGLRRAYVAAVTYERKNRFGLREPRTHNYSFCSVHGRMYAARFKLEVQP